jgi:preprotein translocase subunit SecG
VTTAIATLFMITSLSLGVISSNDKSRSIMPDEVVTTPASSSESSPVDVDKKSE